MATVTNTEDFRPVGGEVVQTAYQTFTATGASDWVRWVDTDITVQIDGAATAINVIIERSSLQPVLGVAAYYAPVSDTAMSGNPASGIPPNIYIEPGLGWWRARVISMTGSPATVSFTGGGLKS